MSEQKPTSEDQHQTARNIILRQLSAAPKTRHQLAQKLRDRHIPDDVIDEVLERFEEVELIDDAAYAEMWVRSRQRSKGLARRALTRELKQRGVADEDVEMALEQITDEDEWEKARELVRKRLSRTSIPVSTDAMDRKQRDRLVRRLVSMLSRKGYSPGLAFSVVTDEMNAQDLDHFDE
jgi:regulatory protein